MPSLHGALAARGFHGPLYGAVARGWRSGLPKRLIGAGDLKESIQSFEAESSEIDDSRTTLSRFGMVRATLQPESVPLRQSGQSSWRRCRWIRTTFEVGRNLGLDAVVDHFIPIGDELKVLRNHVGRDLSGIRRPAEEPDGALPADQLRRQ